jgi:hypothetical protein
VLDTEVLPWEQVAHIPPVAAALPALFAPIFHTLLSVHSTRVKEFERLAKTERTYICASVI